MARKTLSGNSGDHIFTRDFVAGFLAYFTFFIACSALVPTLPLYFSAMGSSAGQIGVLVGIYSVSSLVARLFAGSAISRYSEKGIMIWASLVFAISFIACIILRPFWPFFVVRLFQGIAYACLDTAAFALIVKVTPPVYHGRALGYFLLAPGIATVLAPSFGMFLINRFSFTVLFVLCMGLSLCALLVSGTLKVEAAKKLDSIRLSRKALFSKRGSSFLL